MIGFTKTKQEIRGDQATKVVQKLVKKKEVEKTSCTTKMPDKFSVVWK